MKTSPKSIPAGRFKAECLGLLDRIEKTGESLVVTKRGRPVARVVPFRGGGRRPLRGSVRILGDIVSPLGEHWDAER